MDLSLTGLVIVKNATLNLFSLDTDSGMGAHVIITIPPPHRSNAMMIVREIHVRTTSGVGAQNRESHYFGS